MRRREQFIMGEDQSNADTLWWSQTGPLSVLTYNSCAAQSFMMTAITYQKFEYIILNISCAITQRKSWRVRKYHRSFTCLNGIEGRFVRTMWQVDYHAQPIQFFYHSLSRQKKHDLIVEIKEYFKGRLTFPKLDNPLCSDLPSALSTFEQSALEKKTRFYTSSFISASSSRTPFLLGLDSGSCC